MLADLLDSHPIHQFAETYAILAEPALKSSNVHAQRVGHLADRRIAGRHQQPDRLLDLFRHAPRSWIHDRADELSRMACKRRIGSGKRTIEVGGFNHDPVEVASELKGAV